ncbi:MAG: regulatory protein RecX [Lachnospiraceae bacterium]|nr:regulatory protein RecX [Lachnospiraceae bacterium]
MDKSKARCSAFDKAVNLLAFKDRTTQEIIQKLKEKGYSDDDIEETVDKLSYYGYLNDQNYTISYIKDNASKKGKKLITNELSKKGVDKSVIDFACEEVEIDELSSIDYIISHRFSDANFKDEKTYRRIVNYFLRRGFTYDNIKRSIKAQYHFAYDDEQFC